MWLHDWSFHPAAALIIAGLLAAVIGAAALVGGMRAALRVCATTGGLQVLAGVACGWAWWAAGGAVILLVTGWARWSLREPRRYQGRVR